MTDKIKEFIEKSKNGIKKAAKPITDAAAKLFGWTKKKIMPLLNKLAEKIEPKLITLLEVSIKKLEEMSAAYEARRIARSKLTKKEKFLRYHPRATVFSLILLALFFIIAVYHLFLTGGDTPFTRERVGDYLWISLIPSAIALVMLIVNAFVQRSDSSKKKRGDPMTQDFKISARIEKLRSGFDLENAPDEVKEAIAHQHRRRKHAIIVASVSTAVTLVYALLFALDASKYTVEAVNTDIAGRMIPTLIYTLINLAIWSLCALTSASCKARETEIIKDAIKADKALLIKAENKAERKSHKDLVTNILRGTVIAASVALILLGIMNGGMADVLAKAVKICTECIGLG